MKLLLDQSLTHKLPDTLQRCRTQSAKNLYSQVPKTQWPTLSAMFHTLFQQPDADSVCAQAREVVEFCGQKFPHVADYLEESPDALLAFYYCTETGMNQDLV